MYKAHFKYSLILLAIIFAISACTEPDIFNGKIKFKDNEIKSAFIKKLKTNNLNFKIGRNGYIHYQSKDIKIILTLASEVRNNTCPSFKNTLSWNVSQIDAKNIILSKYPSILNASHILCPTPTKIDTALKGFSKKDEEVWNIRFHCNKGPVNALFFVHPYSGKIFTIKEPNENGKSNCA